MKRRQLWRKVIYVFEYVPFTINTLLFAIAVWISYLLLHKPLPKNTAGDTDSFQALIIIMGRVAFWFVVVLVLISVISTIVTWLIYMIMKDHDRYNLKVE